MWSHTPRRPINTIRVFRRLAILPALVVLAAMLSHPARAFAETGLTTSPSYQNLDVTAGKSTSGTLNFINTGTTDFDVKIYASPFNVSGEQYNQSYDINNNLTDASKWISLDTGEASLKPGERRSVNYKVTVPPDSGPGGRYAAVFAETRPTAIKETGVATTKRVGIIFYMTVSGDIQRAGRVESFEVKQLLFEPPVAAEVRLANTGNTHYRSTVVVVARDIFGRKKAQLSTERFVLPQTVRKFELTWENSPPIGLYKLGGYVEFLGRTQQLPGKYVLAAPLPFMIGVPLVAAAAGGIWIFRKKHKKKQ